MSSDSNPKVQSKFDRSHGKGLKPPHMSLKYATGPITGTKVAGHTVNGAKIPREITGTVNKAD